jgi:hypothetical protein
VKPQAGARPRARSVDLVPRQARRRERDRAPPDPAACSASAAPRLAVSATPPIRRSQHRLPSTDHAQLDMKSVKGPAGNAKPANTGWAPIRYRLKVSPGRPALFVPKVYTLRNTGAVEGRTPTGGSDDVARGGKCMDSVATRVFTFSICRSSSLPVISVWTGVVGPASSGWKSSCCISLGRCAGSRIGGFFGHFFISDSVAESIGWPTGNPFQLEVGVANLAVGILGGVAMGRRDGFREATVIAATVFGVGATVVHVMDVIESGNLAPGNTIQNVSNLLRPALLIAFLAASRRAERSPDSEAQTAGFDRWRDQG